MIENENSEAFSSIEKRVADLESAVANLHQRLSPPMYAGRPAMQSVTGGIPRPPMPPPPPRHDGPSSPVITEEFIGKRVLPTLGAILLLAALGYWAPVAYQRLTPGGAFSIELLFSALFFGAGRVMRNAKFHFGEILSGIGAGGLLVTLAAGSQFQHLYTGQTMVGLCLGASLAIGAYGIILQSRTFEMIGAVGGLISSWMPCVQNEFYISAAIQTVVVSATLILFVQSRWRAGLMVLWPLALIAGGQFIFGTDLDWRWRVAFLDLIGLEFAIAYAFLYDNWEFDPQVAFCWVALGTSVLLSLLVKYGELGSAHLAVMFGLIAISGLAFWGDRKKRELFWWCGGIGMITLVPLGFEIHLAFTILASLACSIAMFSLCRSSAKLSSVALMETVLGMVAYCFCIGRFASLSTYFALLLFCALLTCTFGFHRSSKFGGQAVAGCGALGMILLAQIATNRGVPFGSDAATSGLWALWGLAVLGVGFAINLKAGRLCGYAILAITLLKVIINDLGLLSGALRAATLLVLGLVMLLGGYIAIRSKSSGATE
jgi:hypothetical protein